jgi:hypothetical protein
MAHFVCHERVEERLTCAEALPNNNVYLGRKPATIDIRNAARAEDTRRNESCRIVEKNGSIVINRLQTSGRIRVRSAEGVIHAGTGTAPIGRRRGNRTHTVETSWNRGGRCRRIFGCDGNCLAAMKKIV